MIYQKNADYLKNVEDGMAEAEAPLREYKTTLIDAEDEKLYNQLLADWAVWAKFVDKEKALLRTGKFDEAAALQASEGNRLRKETRGEIKTIVDLNVKAAKATSDKNTVTANAASRRRSASSLLWG